MGATTGGRADTVADAYVALLADRGIEYLFANAGTDFAPLIEALAKVARRGLPAPTALAIPHENLAVAMAHGYTMVTGRPQAVMVHVSVGTANALCGLMNASREEIPILVTAGRTPITESGLQGTRSRPIHWAQEMFDQAAMVREHVKWDYELRAAAQLETVIDRALAIAMSEPRGPVYLTLPRETIAAPIEDFSPRLGNRPSAATLPEPDPSAIAEAARLLASAERPVIVTASVGRDRKAVPALQALAERFAVPVVQHMPRYLNIASDHPMHLGLAPDRLVAEADVVLVVECDVPWIPSLGGPREGCRVLHLGADPLFERYPIRGFPADLVLRARASRALDLLAQALDAETKGDRERIDARRPRIEQMREGLLKARRAELERARRASPIEPAWIAHCLNTIKDEDTILVNELALPPDHLVLRHPGTYFGPSPAGGLGWGLGAALGAKLAARKGVVIAAVGDGSYMFGNPTPAHFVSRTHDLPVLWIVVNNAGWAAVRRATEAMYPDGHAMESNRVPLTSLAPSPDFERIVEASDGFGIRVDDPNALPAALEQALGVVKAENRQALVNVICTPT